MCTHNLPYLNMKKNTIKYPNSAAMGFFPRDPRTSENSHKCDIQAIDKTCGRRRSVTTLTKQFQRLMSCVVYVNKKLYFCSVFGMY